MESSPELAARVREICLALPEMTERASHGVPAWFVRDKRQFAQLWADAYRAVAPAKLIALLDAAD